MKIPFWPDFASRGKIDFSLDRVAALLSRLSNPHLNLPPTIHIAGTNGKGSVVAFLRAIFSHAGLSVHTYTSPHLVNFNERIVLNNAEISDEFLNEVLCECKAAAETEPQIPLTFFEATTVAAFLAFSKSKADVLLLETGMGGRLDATNILPQVLLSIITPIAFDHEEFLGNSLAKIAAEKAGIIKKNCPLIVGKQEAEALEVIKNAAVKLNSKATIFADDWKIKREERRWCYVGDMSMKLDFPALLGQHQVENASVAIAAVLASRLVALSPTQINQALQNVVHQARLQKIKAGRLFDKLPKSYELYLDGSHNLQGSNTVLEFLRERKDKKNVVIFSMLNNKDYQGFLNKISPETDSLIALKITDEEKSLTAEEIAKFATASGIKNVIVAKNFDDAFEKMENSEPTRVLICGSLYLAGEFLSQN